MASWPDVKQGTVQREPDAQRGARILLLFMMPQLERFALPYISCEFYRMEYTCR